MAETPKMKKNGGLVKRCHLKDNFKNIKKKSKKRGFDHKRVNFQYFQIVSHKSLAAPQFGTFLLFCRKGVFNFQNKKKRLNHMNSFVLRVPKR